MRTIDKLKLTQLSKAELEERQMNALRGGATCSCVCIGCACAEPKKITDPSQATTDNGKGALNDSSSTLNSINNANTDYGYYPGY